jgi:hypothetical protein
MDTIGPELHEGWLDRDPAHPISVIPADGQKTMMVKLSLPNICYKFEFSFFDAKGTYWTYDVQSRGLSKAKRESRLKRWPRRAWRRIKAALMGLVRLVGRRGE